MLAVLPRDYFGFLINQECKLAERYSNYFGLVRFGFDHFNYENSDLIPFPDVIKSATRNTDIIGFLEERNVGLLMHNVDIHELPRIVDRFQPIIQKYIRDTQMDGKFSIGGVCFPTDANTAQGLEAAVRSNKF